jgi:hypothetical protein
MRRYLDIGWRGYIAVPALLVFVLLGLCSNGNSATVTMTWEVSSTNLDGQINTQWSYCQWYLWTQATNHTATNHVATGYVGATTNPPVAVTLSATWSNALPHTLYWSRIVTYNTDGQASPMSAACVSQSAPAASKNKSVKVSL